MVIPDAATETAPACLRADAARNRDRILEAARELYGAHGLEAPLSDIARHAGVGIATLYRRFPTAEDLITAVFADKMTAYADAIDTALSDPDPWHGFTTYVERVCGMQAADRGFTSVLTVRFPGATGFEAERDRAFHGFTRLITRAQESGQLRADFCHQDMVMLLMANAGVLRATADAAPDTWRRLVSYLLQAFAAAAAGPLPRPPEPRDMYRALVTPRPAR